MQQERTLETVTQSVEETVEVGARKRVNEDVLAILHLIQTLLASDKAGDHELVAAYAQLWKAIAEPIKWPTRTKTSFSLSRDELLVLICWGVGAVLISALFLILNFKPSDVVQLILYWSGVFGILLGAKSAASLGSSKPKSDN
jgi:hypothetical protein